MVDNWELILNAFHASQVNSMVITNATYQELRAAGELKFLKSAELKLELDEYYTRDFSILQLTIGSIPPYRTTIRRLLPFYIQKHIWTHCQNVTNNRFGNQLLFECESAFSEKEEIKVIDMIMNDQKLLMDLNFWMSNLEVGLYSLENVRAANQNLLGLRRAIQKKNL